MPDTLGSIREEILGWMRGDMRSDDDLPIVNASINDSIESIWMGMMQVQLARFAGVDQPVTFTLAAGSERVRLINIADPTAGPVLAQIVAGALPGRTINVQYTYVTESGTETLPSPASQLIVAANSILTAKLPNQANILNAIGWNLYAAIVPDANFALQNQDPIPFNVTWQEPLPAGIVDYATSQQTVPLVNSTADNVSWITHMEVRTSDTLLRSWNQVDIDSMLMRQFGRTLSSASEYQAYAWDLINGNVLEFRPTAGLTLNPRYFYIAKPRRLRYDQAEIPYTSITGVHEYIVNRSVAKLKLGLDEYLAHQGWIALAGEARSQVILSLNQEGWAKNTRIAPHLY